jgi:hypothetical protein
VNALLKSPKSVLMVLLAVGLVAGGVLSAVALGATSKKHPVHSLRASTSTTATTTGPFKSNEDPAHEAGESAAVEAAEDSGQHPHGGHGGQFKPNEDPAHEAGESAAREAQEDAGQRPTTTP